MWQYDVFTFAPNRAHHAGCTPPRVSPHFVRLALGYELVAPLGRHRTLPLRVREELRLP